MRAFGEVCREAWVIFKVLRKVVLLRTAPKRNARHTSPNVLERVHSSEHQGWFPVNSVVSPPPTAAGFDLLRVGGVLRWGTAAILAARFVWSTLSYTPLDNTSQAAPPFHNTYILKSGQCPINIEKLTFP